jgi:predicted HicB family RNase H-like nuclease
MANKRCQIAFDVHPTLRAQIKIVAARKNISMNLWLMRVIIVALKKEGDVQEETSPKVK